MLKKWLGPLLAIMVLVGYWLIPVSSIQASDRSEAQVSFYRQPSSSNSATESSTTTGDQVNSGSQHQSATTPSMSQSQGWLPQTGEEFSQWGLVGLGLLLVLMVVIASYEHVRWQRRVNLLDA